MNIVPTVYCVRFLNRKQQISTACLLLYNMVYPFLRNIQEESTGKIILAFKWASIKYVDKLLEENISLEKFWI